MLSRNTLKLTVKAAVAKKGTRSSSSTGEVLTVEETAVWIRQRRGCQVQFPSYALIRGFELRCIAIWRRETNIRTLCAGNPTLLKTSIILCGSRLSQAKSSDVSCTIARVKHEIPPKKTGRVSLLQIPDVKFPSEVVQQQAVSNSKQCRAVGCGESTEQRREVSTARLSYSAFVW